MNKWGIERRSIGDAIYYKHNPNGDPFKLKTPETPEEHELYGLGIGLYWGEGNKANKHSVRLGNTDPELMKVFIRFLIELCGVALKDLRFGLQIFSDTDEQAVLDYWTNRLGVKASQFYKITVTISGSLGTYRRKSQYGVLTVYYHNKKLRDKLVGILPR
ncbi:MAG TPA: hypothetical protein VGS28_00690 [Candidatus Saccharimonadales bacterium]|nr:hypothetical protein [Candidatus Saccharimonadales bacterium]